MTSINLFVTSVYEILRNKNNELKNEIWRNNEK